MANASVFKKHSWKIGPISLHFRCCKGLFSESDSQNRPLCLDYNHLQTNKQKILLICPQWPEIFFGKFHDSMEPVPKSETSIR